MLRLNLQKEPYWLELPAKVRVKVRPLTTTLMSAAQSQVIKQIRENDKITDTDEKLGLSEALLIKALARLSLIEWEGVLLPDDDAIAPINENTVSDLMDIWFIAQEFWKQYSNSLQLLEIEGNESGLEPSGISEEGQSIARAVLMPTSPAAIGKTKK